MRFTLPATLIFVSGLAAIAFSCNQCEQGGPAYSWLEIRAILLEGERLEEVREGMRRYRAAMDEIKRDLLTGSLGLEEAGSRLEQAAREHNPRFITSLKRLYPDQPVREQLILTLLSHFRVDEKLGMLTAEEKERVDCLRREHEQGADSR
jgi:hypothetical protein